MKTATNEFQYTGLWCVKVCHFSDLGYEYEAGGFKTEAEAREYYDKNLSNNPRFRIDWDDE